MSTLTVHSAIMAPLHEDLPLCTTEYKTLNVCRSSSHQDPVFSQKPQLSLTLSVTLSNCFILLVGKCVKVTVKLSSTTEKLTNTITKCPYSTLDSLTTIFYKPLLPSGDFVLG